MQERLRFLGVIKKQHAGRDYQNACCINPPSTIRARPDPFVYSQDWLSSRHIAVIWDNPDFKILDSASGFPVDRLDIKPDTKYDIEVTIHNNSIMASLDTIVRFEVHSFGIGTDMLAELPADKVDVPPFGTAIARTQ